MSEFEAFSNRTRPVLEKILADSGVGSGLAGCGVGGSCGGRVESVTVGVVAARRTVRIEANGIVSLDSYLQRQLRVLPSATHGAGLVHPLPALIPVAP